MGGYVSEATHGGAPRGETLTVTESGIHRVEFLGSHDGSRDHTDVRLAIRAHLGADCCASFTVLRVAAIGMVDAAQR